VAACLRTEKPDSVRGNDADRARDDVADDSIQAGIPGRR